MFIYTTLYCTALQYHVIFLVLFFHCCGWFIHISRGLYSLFSNDDGLQGTSLDFFFPSICSECSDSFKSWTHSIPHLFFISPPLFFFHIFKNEIYIRIVLMMARTRFFSISILFILFPSRFQCCWVSHDLLLSSPDDEIFPFPCRAPFHPSPLLSVLLFAHPLSRKPAASSQGNLSHYLFSFGKLLQLWYHH